MGVQERKAREREELRQEILDAARDLFVEQGYEAVSMRKIADRIEYSPTTIYLHFRDKADLFDCLCAETFERLVERLESITAGHPDDPVAGLRGGLRAYIDFGLQHPAHYKVTFMTPAMRQCQEVPSRSDCMGERAFAHLVSGVAACAASGRLRIPNVELTAEVLWAGIHGVTALLITHPDFTWADREALINHLIDTLLRGLA